MALAMRAVTRHSAIPHRMAHCLHWKLLQSSSFYGVTCGPLADHVSEHNDVSDCVNIHCAAEPRSI